jgi:hypothetical protein
MRRRSPRIVLTKADRTDLEIMDEFIEIHQHSSSPSNPAAVEPRTAEKPEDLHFAASRAGLPSVSRCRPLEASKTIRQELLIAESDTSYRKILASKLDLRLLGLGRARHRCTIILKHGWRIAGTLQNWPSVG